MLLQSSRSKYMPNKQEVEGSASFLTYVSAVKLVIVYSSETLIIFNEILVFVFTVMMISTISHVHNSHTV